MYAIVAVGCGRELVTCVNNSRRGFAFTQKLGRGVELEWLFSE